MARNRQWPELSCPVAWNEEAEKWPSSNCVVRLCGSISFWEIMQPWPIVAPLKKKLNPLSHFGIIENFKNFRRSVISRSLKVTSFHISTHKSYIQNTIFLRCLQHFGSGHVSKIQQGVQIPNFETTQTLINCSLSKISWKSMTRFYRNPAQRVYRKINKYRTKLITILLCRGKVLIVGPQCY